MKKIILSVLLIILFIVSSILTKTVGGYSSKLSTKKIQKIENKKVTIATMDENLRDAIWKEVQQLTNPTFTSTRDNLMAEDLARIEELDATGREIKSIEGVDFSKFTNLEKLFLDNNHISNLVGVDFPDSLVRIGFRSNRISSLENVDFPDNLGFLDFQDNQILSLENVDFPDNLSILYLTNNKISSLDGLDFSGFKKLQELRLSNNQISSLAGVNFPDTLVLLSFASNQISTLNGVNFPRAEYIFLNNNQISNLVGVNFSYVAHLSLDNNQIDTMKGFIDAFSGLGINYPFEISMSDNPILEVNPDEYTIVVSIIEADTNIIFNSFPSLSSSISINE